MSTVRLHRALVPLAGLAPLALAQAPDPLEELLNVKVISASRQARRLSESPATMTAITRSEIRRLGLRSVAEALALVPGLYGVDDHFRVDVGVRGVRGGPRDANRILKVMVDGQPVSFRPDGTVSLGPEFIPMEAVERIEVLRGPASALYGANAFLGVIHIITRTPAGEDQGSFSLRVQRERGKAGAAGEALFQTHAGPVALLGAVSYGERDRSRHGVPSGSPIFTSTLSSAPESRNAWSFPTSFLAKARWDPQPAWSNEASFHLTRTSTVAEWLDFGTLSHANHLALLTETSRVQSTWTPAESLRFRGSLAYADSRTDHERLNTGSTTLLPRRDFACRSLDLTLEGQWEWQASSWIIGGLDQTRDRHQLMNLYQLNTGTGVEQRVYPLQGRRTLQNLGMFVQAGLLPWEGAELTLNVRRDDHSLFGIDHTWRASLVDELSARLHGKVILGTSYKAPSPMQLFAEPIYPGDLVGNPDLRPETARTAAIGMDYEAPSGLRATLTAFYTFIHNFIELVPFNTNHRSVNRDQVRTRGLEFSGTWMQRSWEFSTSVAAVNAEQRFREPLKPEHWDPTPASPRLAGSVRATWFPTWGGNVDVQVHHASARRSTFSNTFENYFATYALSPVTAVDLGVLLPLGEWRLQGRILNLLDRMSAEPGTRGYDLPGQRREWILGLSRRF